jgi:hypothetical protein
MTLDFNKARQLCTAPELALVVAVRTEELNALTPKRLQSKIVRARGLRNKFHDLANRQAREARGKAAPRRTRPARGNARTVEKAALFGEVLKRFEARAAKLDQSEARAIVSKSKDAPARKPSRKPTPKKAAARPAPTSRSASRSPSRSLQARSTTSPRSRSQRMKSEHTAAARKQSKLARSQAPRVQAHVSSRNRRGQARRDARR